MIVYIINWLIWSFIQSLIFTGLFLFLFYWFYVKKIPQTPTNSRPQFEQFILDDTLIAMIDKNKDGLNGDTNSAIALNMFLQFLFQEMKDAKAVRRYIIRKISIEFQELLTTKTAGKFIERLSARDFSLGTSFPIIHSFKLINYEMDSSKKLIDEMSILVDLEYKNGFSISVDADLILGKSAYTHIKVALIKGKARIQLSRQPFTHWNFAFVEEPIVEIDGSSQFEGRSMPKLTYLIVNQLRRSIRRKHTLPNYKIRFKPFFEPIYDGKLYKSNIEEFLQKQNIKKNETKPEKPTKYNESIQYSNLCEKIGLDLSSVGQLQIYLNNCDRLPEALYTLNLNQAQNPKQATETGLPKSNSNQQLLTTNSSPSEKDQCFIYLTTSLDNYSMKQLMDKRITRESWPFIEFEIKKTSLNQSIGINFMEVFFVNKTEICIQKIFPNSLASQVKTIKQFDILYSINQVPCSSIKTLNKLIQKFGLQTLKFVVQRPSVVSKKSLVKMSSFPQRISAAIDEESVSNGQTENDSVASQKIQSEIFNQNISASSLVDFYCNVSECSNNEHLNTLDLIALLTDFDQEQDTNRFKKTRDIKLEKENLFSLTKTRLPIQIGDNYKFDLNYETKYINIFLWTVQYLQKSTRQKPLLIGYVSVPLNELSVDCWTTTKGETQSTLYFRPVEELKASAISKIAKSHVISDHIGFDTNISLGNITINFQHIIEEDLNKKEVSATIAQDLIENNDLEANLLKQERTKTTFSATSSPNVETNEETDDGTHKFLNVQFNQMIICEICNKKIWFKNAYQCGYCGYTIHIKCYEKAINKTICPRFFSKNNLSNKSPETCNDDSFVILNDQDLVIKPKQARSKSPSELSITSTVSDVGPVRAKVTSFFNGLRQRNVLKSDDQETKTKSTSNLLGYIRSRRKEAKNEEVKSEKNSDESGNLEGIDEFKDIDPSSVDKIFGTELFEDLDETERRVKYEELIVKYQNTIDMMTKLKADLEKELDLVVKAKSVNSSTKKIQQLEQQQEGYKMQIKHLDEQLKCVLFLLMQCKLGLDNLCQNDQRLPDSSESRQNLPNIVISNSDTSDSCDDINQILQ